MRVKCVPFCNGFCKGITQQVVANSISIAKRVIIAIIAFNILYKLNLFDCPFHSQYYYRIILFALL